MPYVRLISRIFAKILLKARKPETWFIKTKIPKKKFQKTWLDNFYIFTKKSHIVLDPKNPESSRIKKEHNGNVKLESMLR